MRTTLPARRCLQRQVWQGETDDASALEMQRSSALSTWRGEEVATTAHRRRPVSRCGMSAWCGRGVRWRLSDGSAEDAASDVHSARRRASVGAFGLAPAWCAVGRAERWRRLSRRSPRVFRAAYSDRRRVGERLAEWRRHQPALQTSDISVAQRWTDWDLRFARDGGCLWPVGAVDSADASFQVRTRLRSMTRDHSVRRNPVCDLVSDLRV
jgi:hypothetical protein